MPLNTIRAAIWRAITDSYIQGVVYCTLPSFIYVFVKPRLHCQSCVALLLNTHSKNSKLWVVCTIQWLILVYSNSVSYYEPCCINISCVSPFISSFTSVCSVKVSHMTDSVYPALCGWGSVNSVCIKGTVHLYTKVLRIYPLHMFDIFCHFLYYLRQKKTIALPEWVGDVSPFSKCGIISLSVHIFFHLSHYFWLIAVSVGTC